MKTCIVKMDKSKAGLSGSYEKEAGMQEQMFLHIFTHSNCYAYIYICICIYATNFQHMIYMYIYMCV